MADRLINPPESTDRAHVESLGYIAATDEVLGKDYAYAAWKETDPRTGKWKLKIRGNLTAHTSLDPDHPHFWTHLALKLARNHVPFFQMDERRSGKRTWLDGEYFLLRLYVMREMQKIDGLTEQQACQKIARKRNGRYYRQTGLYTRLKEAQRLDENPDQLFDFEKASSSPPDEIDAIIEELGALIQREKEERNRWLDK